MYCQFEYYLSRSYREYMLCKTKGMILGALKNDSKGFEIFKNKTTKLIILQTSTGVYQDNITAVCLKQAYT